MNKVNWWESVLQLENSKKWKAAMDIDLNDEIHKNNFIFTNEYPIPNFIVNFDVNKL